MALIFSVLAASAADGGAGARGAGAPPLHEGRGRRPFVSLVPSDRVAALEGLFARLAGADAGAVADIAGQIRAIWARPESATTALFLDFGRKAISARNLPLALDCFEEAIAREPMLAEAYLRRANAYYAAGDLGRSIADLRTVLRLEPRHFPAMQALAAIMIDLGEEGRALELLGRIRMICPRFAGLGEAIARLEARRRGRDI